jgi:glycosyltransferase involved in cell wall biosynthesis
LIEDGKSGLVIPPLSPLAIAGAIEKLYFDTDLLKKIKKEALKRIEKDFNVRQTVSQHLELYRGVVSRK